MNLYISSLSLCSVITSLLQASPHLWVHQYSVSDSISLSGTDSLWVCVIHFLLQGQTNTASALLGDGWSEWQNGEKGGRQRRTEQWPQRLLVCWQSVCSCDCVCVCVCVCRLNTEGCYYWDLIRKDSSVQFVSYCVCVSVRDREREREGERESTQEVKSSGECAVGHNKTYTHAHTHTLCPPLTGYKPTIWHWAVQLLCTSIKIIPIF